VPEHCRPQRQPHFGHDDLPSPVHVTLARSADRQAPTRLGEHGAAIRWCRTARTAADASGDLAFRLLVGAEEAGFGLYGQRDPLTVLTLTTQAQAIAGAVPSVGQAKIIATRAKALSLLGRHADARRALKALADVSEGELAGQGPSFWTPDQIHFAESWVHAHAGDQSALDEAGDAIARYPLDYQYRTNIQLHQALCITVQGGIDQGIRHAATVLHGLPSHYRTGMVLETARMVLRAVPADRQERHAVAELRDALAIAPAGTDA